MIIGLGTDLTDIRRVERAIVRFGDRFLARLFTITEQWQTAHSSFEKQITTYAKCFAAKEACVKALGIGLTQGIRWLDLEVVREETGYPSMYLAGRAASYLATIVPHGMVVRVNVTLSDAYPFAHAVVIISAVHTCRQNYLDLPGSSL